MGCLTGLKVIEMAGIGPAPMCAMMLSDMGAEVLKIDRTTDAPSDIKSKSDLLNRGRQSVCLDLKQPQAVEALLKLVERADALIEGFRPGVMERLGLGPDVSLARNPRLVYGRMTGWGQEGPLAQTAGHDINYIALMGALHAIGRKGEPPLPPLNLLGDFGGGAMFLLVGVLAALLEAKQSGKGQVVDVAMVDGVGSLMTALYGALASGKWTDRRGSNVLDTGAHYYQTYETKDGKYVAVGAIEPKFYSDLVRLTNLDNEPLPRQTDRSGWDQMKVRLATIFRSKTRDEWCEIMEGSDACFAPVLSLAEAPTHPHNTARKAFIEYNGVLQPAPAPRFSRTPSAIQSSPAGRGEHTHQALKGWGLSSEELHELLVCGAIPETGSEDLPRR